MIENHYISELETALKQLPVEERKDIIQDIRGYFIDGSGDGKTDQEIASSLGSPQSIAEEYLLSYSFVQSYSDESESELITIHDDSYKKIDINVQHGSLFVKPSDSSITTVELVGTNDKLQLTAEVVGETLVIRLKNLRHWLFMFNFNMKAVTLNVFIPIKLYQSIAMKTDNGRISAEKLLGKKVDVKTDNGRIQLNEMAASTLTAETDNGRIEMDKVQADYIKSKTDNGRIELRYVEGETISAESDNGRIVLEHVEGNLVGITDNGRITLLTTSLDRTIDFKTDNGGISIKTESEPTNVTIHAKTGHGRVDVFGERNSRTIIGLGENSIRLKSDNGRITVN